MLQASRAGITLWPAIETVFAGVFGARPYDLTADRQNEWLCNWSRKEEGSLRVALSRFTEEGDPSQRVAEFLNSAQQADVVGTEPYPTYALAFGSLFNFVAAPLSLPVVRPLLFQKLQRLLGYELPPASLVEQYDHHLAFAAEVEARLRDAGVPVRDMIDVQSLIWSASRFEAHWSPNDGSDETLEPSRSHEHYLSVCAIYRDEAEYLAEWLEFHRLVGVDRFYLYNNFSDDAHMEVLGDYVDDGLVVLHDWPVQTAPQTGAYAHCLESHGAESRWIAFIDIDEFLFSPSGESVSDMLVSYERYPGVAVNQALFGPSGHRVKPSGLVIESYLQRQNLGNIKFIKSIVDPIRTSHPIGVHHFAYESGLAVDENGYPLRDAKTWSVSASKLRINHYRTKSEAELRQRRTRPDAARGKFFPWPDFLQLRHDYPELDDSLLQYAPRVRTAVESHSAS